MHLYLFLTLFIYFFTTSSVDAFYLGRDSSNDSSPASVPYELIVKFRAGEVEVNPDGKIVFLTESSKKFSEQFQIEFIEPVFKKAAPESPLARTFKIRFAEGIDMVKAREFFSNHPSVEYAEPNQIAEVQTIKPPQD